MDFFMIVASMALIAVTVVLIGLFVNRYTELNMLNVLIAAAICILMGGLVSIFLAEFGSAFFS